METSNKSFWELISDFTINIPIIQRDYAQGRVEEKEKRDKFLDAIFRHLTKYEKLDLDFVYGRINKKVFYPIDGQQRLTTLFLLHWYAFIKDASIKGKIDESEKSNLTKFVYDTRISSREFCKALIIEKIEIPSISKDDNFIAEIKNNHWYRSAWEKDPTIKAMLTMIQAIHGILITDSENELWDKLTKKRLITFQVLDLGSKGFELTDELYIKMNARGKQLTPFENFKANFIQFIEKTFKDKKLQHPIKGNISYAGYFAYKIEKEWTDLFWAFRDESKVIDNLFMNYFGYIAQMCFFQSNKNAKADDFVNNSKQFEQIFKVEENLLFLFNSLDKVYDIASNKGVVEKNRVKEFFELIFQKGPIDINHEPKVRLFWNSSDIINLFESCICKGLDEDQRNKIVLYVTIHYLLKHKSKEVNDGLRYYIRIVRNLLQATRQSNDTKYNTNVRINNWGNYWSLFKQLETENAYQSLQQQIDSKLTLITDGILNYERIKAKIILDDEAIKTPLFSLEEFNYFGSLIHQLKPQDNINKLKDYSRIIREIWNDKISDTLIIQALIACDFRGVHIKDCKMGEMWYFGKKGNWSTILTNEEDKISKSIILLLDRYIVQPGNSAENRLKAIVEDWFRINKDDRSWKYYFMKYSAFTIGLNYYVWPNDYELRILGTEGSNPLLAFHINPFVLTVCRTINDKKICDEKYCYQQYSGNSPLNLKNGVTLTSTLEGWLIDNKTVTFSPEIISIYKLEQRDTNFILKENNSKDRIEIAVDFINDITK
jgi:hypothetical protein